MWSGFRCITNYKGKNWSTVQPNASLPDTINTIYARFDADNTEPTMSPQVCRGTTTLTLQTADVRRSFKKVNDRKAPGPGGIPGRALRECAEQLAEVFINIFNLSLSQSVVPTPFKASIIVPVPKKPLTSCLNDYRPVGLTSVIMKCFERLVKTHMCSSLPDTLDPLQLAYRPNRATEDAIAMTTHTALTNLDKGNYICASAPLRPAPSGHRPRSSAGGGAAGRRVAAAVYHGRSDGEQQKDKAEPKHILNGRKKKRHSKIAKIKAEKYSNLSRTGSISGKDKRKRKRSRSRSSSVTSTTSSSSSSSNSSSSLSSSSSSSKSRNRSSSRESQKKSKIKKKKKEKQHKKRGKKEKKKKQKKKKNASSGPVQISKFLKDRDKNDKYSTITGKKIKMKVKKTKGDKQRDRNRAELLQFLNSAM
ncbi:uncharacterized protein DDB_G0271670-like [Amblyraja radiata]|uniref:uncharacterized protein DDB_G0271670-like n=1 Tax=Amblyraja radiata TaxID=386614 RepID=UPI0014020A0F|nr:uncharacterized protein DDB_G0271670-like [Amblyraja radiata]